MCAALLCVVCASLAPISAEQHDHATAPAAGGAWQWTIDANAFFGLNHQERAFRDFTAVESQNWMMVQGGRGVGPGTFQVTSMLSFEPFTMRKLGSSQVFQTGEVYQDAPLIDYQHPHDLFMQLGASYSWPIGSARAIVETDLVGSPSLGPTVFMHRPSAIENPQAPLSHHQMDSTHITPGVIRVGVERAGVSTEASWFRGLEPDERRTDLDTGSLDSYALRLSWTKGAWRAQVSGGRLHAPEWVEPFSDVTRLTASVAYTSGALAAFAGWGQNRELHGIKDSYVLEATWRATDRDAFYTRDELSTRDILGLGGRHPQGFTHFHPLSKVAAMTAGYVRDVAMVKTGRYGIGADVTGYVVPDDLKPYYGSPWSYHVFLRYRPARAAGAVHTHH